MLRLVVFGVIAYLVVRGLKAIMGPVAVRPSGVAPPAASAPERAPHDVLGVSARATPDEARAAYQRLVHENHPDRVASMSQEIRDLAERRTKELNRAYEWFKRAKAQ